MKLIFYDFTNIAVFNLHLHCHQDVQEEENQDDDERVQAGVLCIKSIVKVKSQPLPSLGPSVESPKPQLPFHVPYMQ